MEKVDYKHGTFTLVDTDPLQFEYESYEEFCEGNDLEPQGEDSEDYMNWRYEEAEEQYNCDMDEIRCCKRYNVPCIITGHLGLWDGSHEIAPTKMDTIYDAIVRCYGRDSLSNLKVNFEDGKIVVYYSHHDGTNVFTIYALSESGVKKYEDWEYKGKELNLNKRDIKRLPYLYAIGN
jgi:hypothetical protein